ncbi:flagellar basal-body rod protein FlgC [Alkaliphilus metalliredigens QYMF]|uniref:Flagellar basal-body rod protein FlgC n=1 Tax=Alkaliphilus metalliredigens (strain QYMF) TaxID=293826 RepID=A6TRR1_ALKMQ|nr:flagellar basal body rod protein FlgC [Alkaliphilus metalliredigens]ABR48879.1 flagellar basal-body rod protein FlgC [Alkaliphilus metalliredigens QYMF]
MSYFNAINTSASGLTAERFRMDTISKNIANANTTRTPNGSPYKRQVVLFQSKEDAKGFSSQLERIMNNNEKPGGVEVVGVKNDSSPYRQVYDPGHPDANEEGYVLMPNVDIVVEMANMISATRAYEANTTALNATKSMAMKALEIGR